MKLPTRLLDGVKQVLLNRAFSEEQIAKIIPRLHEKLIEEPAHLGEIVDTWNLIMNSSSHHSYDKYKESVAVVAEAPSNSLLGKIKINMTHILGDIEPDLLLFEPNKLKARHIKVKGLGLTHNIGQQWILLYNAPRGFYLQDWFELTKKIYYIEQYLLDFLYDKKERKAMEVHPLVKSAAVVESDFDHIRTRYLFASRSGYKTLSHMFSVRSALEMPTLTELIMSDNETYLDKFSPFCSEEEYKAFSNLIKRNDFDEDDAQIFENLAELNALDYKA